VQFRWRQPTFALTSAPLRNPQIAGGLSESGSMVRSSMLGFPPDCRLSEGIAIWQLVNCRQADSPVATRPHEQQDASCGQCGRRRPRCPIGPSLAKKHEKRVTLVQGIGRYNRGARSWLPSFSRHHPQQENIVLDATLAPSFQICCFESVAHRQAQRGQFFLIECRQRCRADPAFDFPGVPDWSS